MVKGVLVETIPRLLETLPPIVAGEKGEGQMEEEEGQMEEGQWQLLSQPLTKTVPFLILVLKIWKLLILINHQKTIPPFTKIIIFSEVQNFKILNSKFNILKSKNTISNNFTNDRSEKLRLDLKYSNFSTVLKEGQSKTIVGPKRTLIPSSALWSRTLALSPGPVDPRGQYQEPGRHSAGLGTVANLQDVDRGAQKVYFVSGPKQYL